MTYITHYLINMALNPVFLCVIAFLGSFVCLCFYGDTIGVRVGFGLTLLFLWIFSSLWFPLWIARLLEKDYTFVREADPAVRWVVVFGGGEYTSQRLPANQRLSPASLQRLLEGVRLYKQLPDAKLLLSGGSWYHDALKDTEAGNMAKLMDWFQITPAHVVLDARSVNTESEAVEIASLVKKEPFYLVTSAIHMQRAMYLCEKQGLHPIPAPVAALKDMDQTPMSFLEQLVPTSSALMWTAAVWHEYVGLAKVKGFHASKKKVW